MCSGAPDSMDRRTPAAIAAPLSAKRRASLSNGDFNAQLLSPVGTTRITDSVIINSNSGGLGDCEEKRSCYRVSQTYATTPPTEKQSLCDCTCIFQVRKLSAAWIRRSDSRRESTALRAHTRRRADCALFDQRLAATRKRVGMMQSVSDNFVCRRFVCCYGY